MDYLEYANSPAMWVFAAAIFAVVIVQAVIFYRYAKSVSAEAELTSGDQRRALRIGAVSAIGPSIAVAIVAIGLLPVFGTPATLMRIGMVGSVPYELAAANIASQSIGVELGGPGFDGTAFAAVFFTMALGAGVWMAVVLFGAKSMGTLSTKVRAWKPWVMNVVPGAALIGAFSYLTMSQASGGFVSVLVLLGSGAAMALLLLAAKRWGKGWIREWALGLSMVTGLVVAMVLQTNGM